MIRSFNWMDHAACLGADPDLFFPENTQSKYTEAKAICASCPVRQQCGEYAEEIEQGACRTNREGFWGGQAPTVRARQARAAGAANLNTQRQKKILRFHEAGLDANAIAEKVGCTPRTVWRITAQHRSQQAVKA